MADGVALDMDKLKETFFIETEEHISIMESSILELEASQDDLELLNSIFRAAHSVKGNSGCLGYTDIYSFTHAAETVLDRLRNGVMKASEEVVSVLLESLDCIKLLVGAAQEERECYGEVEGALKKLEGLVEDLSEEGAEAVVEEALSFLGSSETLYKIVFRPGAELLKCGMDPFNIIKHIRNLGDVVRITPDISMLPDLCEMDPELSYLAWDIVLSTTRGQAAIDDIFDFVRDESHVEVSLYQEEEGASQAETTPDDTGDKGPVKAVTASKEPVRDKKKVDSTIRVDTEKVDNLVNLVGELLITQSMVSRLTSGEERENVEALRKTVAELERNTAEIQETVMSIRMMPIGTVFSRFLRLVRDLAVKREKKVKLKISGKETELDKTVIERLVDPLTHLLRNSLDHGIESPEDRVASGKQETGTISLNAFHEGGNVIITVEDDGKGLDRDVILKKAISKGLVEEGEELSDNKVFNLIFMPGFSTAEMVTDISGRGVGMDVVKRNISDMGGSVSIESEPGRYTRFVLKLPLTLAIIEGLTVAVGGERFILPITAVVESKRPSEEEVKSIEGTGEVMNFRGNYVPIVRLHRIFSVEDARQEPQSALVVVIAIEGIEYGLLVDELIGEQQVVIKGLGSLHGLAGIAGATILGDGKVALIIDTAGLIKRSVYS